MFATIARSQTSDELIEKGISQIYHLQLDSARSTMEQVIKMKPNDPDGYFFDAMIVWWTINLNKENSSLDELFYSKANNVIRVCDRLLDANDKNVKALFYKGGALGYTGLVNSLRESWFKAAENGKEALNLLQEAYEINPQNKDVIFGVGLYNYFAEYVPEVYPVVKPLMLIFPKGDKLKGLSQIKESSLNSKYAKTEARFVLAYLHLIYEKNYEEAERYSRSLHEDFPENPVFERYLYSSLVGLSRWQEALEGWKNVIAKIDSSKFGYDSRGLIREANYYAALCLFRLARPLEAEQYLAKSETLTKQMDPESESAISSYIYLMSGMLNDLKGNESAADMYYDKVLGMKNFQNSHEEAERLKRDRYK